jgi:DNA-binding response OmpR family regulator
MVKTYMVNEDKMTMAISSGEQMEKKTVLVVDDDPSIVELIKDTLGSMSYNLVGAYNGKEAVSALSNGKVDLVVADIMLTDEMSGYDVCKHIKSDKVMNKIPVMMLSAKNQMNDKLDAVDAGADDYMTKPFNPSELAKRVRLNLNLHF